MVRDGLEEWVGDIAEFVRLSLVQERVLQVLARMCNGAFVCFPAQRTIMRLARCSSYELGQSFVVLEAEGLVFRFRRFLPSGREGSNMYFVNRPGLSGEEVKVLLPRLCASLEDRKVCEGLLESFLAERERGAW